MWELLDTIMLKQFIVGLVNEAAPHTGDQAMKLIVPMIALIIVAVVLVVVVAVMANKDKKKKNGFKDFNNNDFKDDL